LFGHRLASQGREVETSVFDMFSEGFFCVGPRDLTKRWEEDVRELYDYWHTLKSYIYEAKMN
jgi:hypothetical protein